VDCLFSGEPPTAIAALRKILSALEQPEQLATQHQQRNIPYNPLSTNSNTYAHGVEAAAGLPHRNLLCGFPAGGLVRRLGALPIMLIYLGIIGCAKKVPVTPRTRLVGFPFIYLLRHWQVLGVYFSRFIDTKTLSPRKDTCNYIENDGMAERVGFEPTVGFPLHSLSRRALSTAQTPLRGARNFASLTNSLRPHNSSGSCSVARNQRSRGTRSQRPKSVQAQGRALLLPFVGSYGIDTATGVRVE
jgi:hypothetical protein